MLSRETQVHGVFVLVVLTTLRYLITRNDYVSFYVTVGFGGRDKRYAHLRIRKQHTQHNALFCSCDAYYKQYILLYHVRVLYIYVFSSCVMYTVYA